MKKLKIGISCGAVAFATAHLLFPQINIDIVTAFLLLLAVLPWLAPIIKSIELPGGLKIELQDIKNATDKIEPPDESHLPPGGPVSPTSRIPIKNLAEIQQLDKIVGQDPNLTLVALRIAIEKRLRESALSHGISDTGYSINHLLVKFSETGLLPINLISGIRELVHLGNHAAHGVDVSQPAARYALEVAPSLLSALDQWFKPNVMSAGAGPHKTFH